MSCRPRRFAGQLAFDCGTPDPAHPELGAHLVKFDGEDKGKIIIGEAEMEAMVLRGLDTLTFLHIGDGFTLQYAVHTEAGFYDYSACGQQTRRQTWRVQASLGLTKAAMG